MDHREEVRGKDFREIVDENVFWVGDRGLEAAENQIIIVVDEFRSGYECERCGDREHRIKRGGEAGQTESIVDCENCSGVGHYPKANYEIKCSHCEGSGKIACPECNGKGSPSVVLAEQQKGRPTTGLVVSVGENVKRYRRGDRLLCPSFAGHGLELAGINLKNGKMEEALLTILVENDILARVHGGSLERKGVKRSMALHTNA